MRLQSARLQIRLVQDEDFPSLFRLQSDPDFMRYIRAADTEESAVWERIQTWKKYASENPGLGVFVLESIESQHFMGYAVLRHVDFQPGKEVEVGYAIDVPFAGQGLATEAALCLMNHARQTLGEKMVVAFTHPDNAPSNHILEKCGFARKGLEDVSGEKRLRWESVF
jgi:ribosomal-protein-alanine N-acetyltransferase